MIEDEESVTKDEEKKGREKRKEVLKEERENE